MSGFFSFPSYKIYSRETLANAAESFGLLPFFPNIVKGLSVEELCAPGMLFGGNYDEGCWEWKGPVIRERKAAYGKFFHSKAGFVSINLLRHFLNYRRSAYPLKSGSMDEMLLEIIKENDSLTSTELKVLIYNDYTREDWTELPEIQSANLNLSTTKKGRKSLESPLQRLQMGGHIIISDFEYKITKRGERYGWGVARYSTPEIVFDGLLEKPVISPQESYDFIVDFMTRRWKNSSKKQFELLLK